jgi:hypothetical protein
LEFAFGLRYNPDKPQRYYDLQERKVSAAPSKRYDKRWQEIPSWADGTCLNMMGILREGHYNSGFLQTYSIVRDCYQYRNELGEYSPQPSTQLELDKIDPECDLEGRFGAVTAILKGCHLLKFARGSVESYRQNLAYRAERDAKIKQEEVA